VAGRGWHRRCEVEHMRQGEELRQRLLVCGLNMLLLGDDNHVVEVLGRSAVEEGG
jgi:hypothetical protein